MLARKDGVEMTEDLSIYHDLIGNLFTKPSISEERASYRLSESQVEFYREYGYLSGIRMLDDEQVEVLRDELRGLIDPAHPGHQLFYEFNSNESADPEKIFFMRSEHGVSRRVFTTSRGTLGSPCQPRSCSLAPCASGTIRSFIN